MNERISVGQIEIVTDALGPGKRIILWVQNCKKRCPGCIAPSFQGSEGAELYSVSALIDYVKYLRMVSGASGITLSGGEPLLQWQGLRQIMQALIREDASLDVIMFTGYKFNFETMTFNADNLLPEGQINLDFVDVLVDGEFEKELSGRYYLRGSANQRIHLLTQAGHDRFKNVDTAENKSTIQIFTKRNIFIAGIPDYKDISRWENHLVGNMSLHLIR